MCTNRLIVRLYQLLFALVAVGIPTHERGQLADAHDIDIVDAIVRENRAASIDGLRQKARESPNGMVNVLVALDVPGINLLQKQSAESKTFAQSLAIDAALSQSIRNVSNVTLAALAGDPHALHRIFKTVPGMSLSVSEPALKTLESQREVVTVIENSAFRPTLEDTTRIIGATIAWAQGFDGSGQFVAVLDTGLLRTHEMFAGTTIVEACFSEGNESDPDQGDCPNGEEEQIGDGAAAPHPSAFAAFDHGTHVAGIAVGNGPTIDGVARNAGLIAVTVFSRHADDSGCIPPGSSCLLAHQSDQIAGLEHVFSLRNTFSIAAVNMSLGGGCFNDQNTCNAAGSFFAPAISNLRAAGILTVIAAGNDGCCDGISLPGCLSSAIAVGATDDGDDEASFSNFNAMLDLYAPGVQVQSAVTSDNNSYSNKSGTSMATPHVAGAVAVLRSATSGLSLNVLQEAMLYTGDPVTGRCGSTPSQRRLFVPRAILAAQADTWVDFSNHGSETGTIFAPFNTLLEGTVDVPEGGSLAIKAGSSVESLTINKAMTIRSFRGSTTVTGEP